MRTIGNILWFIFGGLLGGLAWVFAGCIWCITIIGIPIGLQCFKFATLAFWPFGKEIVYGTGMFSFLVNLIWIVFFGWEMALGNLIVGCIWFYKTSLFKCPVVYSVAREALSPFCIDFAAFKISLICTSFSLVI